MDNVNELSKSIQDMAKQHIQDMYDLTEKYTNESIQLMVIILDDIIDSYDKLIQIRTQCIDKDIKVISFLFKDEIDISKPMKSLIEKQHNDIAAFEKEVAPFKELREQLLSDTIPSEDEMDKILAKFNEL